MEFHCTFVQSQKFDIKSTKMQEKMALLNLILMRFYYCWTFGTDNTAPNTDQTDMIGADKSVYRICGAAPLNRNYSSGAIVVFTVMMCGTTN